MALLAKPRGPETLTLELVLSTPLTHSFPAKFLI
jgi:hypothetical protein